MEVGKNILLSGFDLTECFDLTEWIFDIICEVFPEFDDAPDLFGIDFDFV